MHRLVTDTVRSRVVCCFFYILSRIMFNSLLWLDFLSNWSCCSHNLLASKKTDLTKKTHPLLCHSAHFFQPAAVSCACEFGCAQVVFCACVPRTSSPPQPQANHPDKKGFSEILENFLTARHSVFQTLSGFRAYSHSVIKKFKSFRCTLFT